MLLVDEAVDSVEHRLIVYLVWVFRTSCLIIMLY